MNQDLKISHFLPFPFPFSFLHIPKWHGPDSCSLIFSYQWTSIRSVSFQFGAWWKSLIVPRTRIGVNFVCYHVDYKWYEGVYPSCYVPLFTENFWKNLTFIYKILVTRQWSPEPNLIYLMKFYQFIKACQSNYKINKIGFCGLLPGY